MVGSTIYQPVMPHDSNKNMKEGATATATVAEAGGKTGLWTRITNHVPFLRTKRGIAVAVIAALVIIGGGLAGLAALRSRSSTASDSGGSGSGGGTSANAITDDAYFYGQSPPVYPSRECPFHPVGHRLVRMPSDCVTTPHVLTLCEHSKYHWIGSMGAVIFPRTGDGG